MAQQMLQYGTRFTARHYSAQESLRVLDALTRDNTPKRHCSSYPHTNTHEHRGVPATPTAEAHAHPMHKHVHVVLHRVCCCQHEAQPGTDGQRVEVPPWHLKTWSSFDLRTCPTNLAEEQPKPPKNGHRRQGQQFTTTATTTRPTLYISVRRQVSPPSFRGRSRTAMHHSTSPTPSPFRLTP